MYRCTAGQTQNVVQEERESLLLGHHLVDLWMGLCVCHNLITEEAEEGLPPAYQVHPPP